MILRWTDPAYGQHYLDSIDHVAVVGSWGWNETSAGRSCAADPTDVDRDIGNTVEIPDWGALYECATVHHSTPRSLWRDGTTPLAQYVHVTRRVDDKRTVTEVHVFLCVWFALLNDRGDTIDQIVRRPRNG